MKLTGCRNAEPALCPLCGAFAVLPLNAATRVKQPDATTHVCHPLAGGCNHGFEETTDVKDARTGRTIATIGGSLAGLLNRRGGAK